MIELPRNNGKRRYFIKSLHTTNYYVAQEKIKNMTENSAKQDIDIKTQTQTPIQNPVENIDYSIKQITESMLKKANNVKSVEQNRWGLIKKMLKEVGLTIDKPYSNFYQADIIQKMCDNIKSASVTGNVKRTHAREIKNLINHANYMNPDVYKTNLINLIPDFKKTRKEESSKRRKTD